jgi:hypothetical protein
MTFFSATSFDYDDDCNAAAAAYSHGTTIAKRRLAAVARKPPPSPATVRSATSQPRYTLVPKGYNPPKISSLIVGKTHWI